MLGQHIAITVVIPLIVFSFILVPVHKNETYMHLNLEAVFNDQVHKEGGLILVEPLPIHEIDDGIFTLTVAQPSVHQEPRYICECKVDTLHTVGFGISNMNRAYAFGFAISYNNTLLTGDLQSIDICDAFAPPYEQLNELIVDNGNGKSTLIVQLQRPCEKPTVTHQEGPVATFNLTSKYTIDHTIPLCQNSTIVVDWVYMMAKCGCAGDNDTRTYGYGTPPVAVDFPLNATNHAPINYFWRPRIGDLNLDGAADIQDVQALAVLYGIDTGGTDTWGNLDGRGLPAIVDIFDFVVVAKYFGKPYECHVDWEGCWPDL